MCQQVEENTQEKPLVASVELGLKVEGKKKQQQGIFKNEILLTVIKQPHEEENCIGHSHVPDYKFRQRSNEICQKDTFINTFKLTHKN